MARPMTDRILSSVLWLTIMSLIAGAAIAGLFLVYSGFLNLLTRQFETAGMLAGTGLLLAAAAWVLVRHSDDLIDRRRTR